MATNDELAKEVGRKAMIILTDGQDYGSRLKTRDAVEAAQKADAICYVLLIADKGFYGPVTYFGEGDMKRLTEETGGRMIDVGASEKTLRQAFQQLRLALQAVGDRLVQHMAGAGAGRAMRRQQQPARHLAQPAQ